MEGLRAQALQARGAGAHGRAVEAWRAMLRQHPDDWRLGLELKHELKAALVYPDSDPQFRRAARALPDPEWIAHYGALYAFHADDLAFVEARARQQLERAPGEHRLLAIIGDVAAQRRDWPASEAAFAAAWALEARAEYRDKRETAAMYSRMARLLAEAPSPVGASGTADYAIVFMNLDRNSERATEMREQYANGAVPLLRHPGIEGRRLAAPAVRRLGGDPGMLGTLGCFLSHASAWEAMLTRGDRMCLFVEDDTIPQLDLPSSLAALNLPDEFDLVFVNRLAPKLDPARTTGFTLHTMAAVMARFDPEENAPGGDGYVLSRKGAEKLLAWVGEDGFSEDVDWRLIAYALTPSQRAAIPRPSHAGPWLDRISTVIRRDARLNAYALHPPLIRTVGVSSDREDENRLHSAA